MDFNRASDYIIQRLHSELSPTLYYHSLEHTLDVLDATRRLNEAEQTDETSKILLETAALYHDAGMLVQYADHEAMSVKLAKEDLPGFGYTKAEIDQISELIMVTRLPQRAVHPLEQIICDADLDYLGRNDFLINSFRLRLEWQVNGIKNTTLEEWFDIQVAFLDDHRYFTRSAFSLRNEFKIKNLSEILSLINR
ncbi:MAG: HD domain-containing protein [Bacteroidota bacterium]